MRVFTLASCALYFLTGLTAISIGSVMPQLLSWYNASYTVGGQLIFAGSLGFFAGVLISSYLSKKYPEKQILSVSALAIACAQFGIFLLPPMPVFMALYFLNSLGSSMIGIVVATLIIEVFIGRQAVAMSYLEVAFGLGAFTMPILASLFIALDIWRFLFLITMTLALILALVWTKVEYSTRAVPSGGHGDAAEEVERPLDANKKWTVLGLFALIVFLYGGLEGSVNNFLSSIFMDYLDVLAYYASISIGVFWAAMVIGRAITGFIIRKMTYRRYLTINIIGTIVSLVLFIAFKQIIAGYLFVGTLGLMMSGIYSITLVYANHAIPNNAHLVTPVISGLSGLGVAIFPALTGIAIDQAGMLMALWYLVGIAFMYLIFLILIDQIRNGRMRPFPPFMKRHRLRLAFAMRRSRFR